MHRITTAYVARFLFLIAAPSLAQGNRADSANPFMLSNKLSWACRHGDVSTASSLIAAGADPNFRFNVNGLPPVLLNAVVGGNRDIVKLLIDHGADPKRAKSDPLIFQGVATGDIEILRLLLLHGADPNQTGGQGMMLDTPLMIAAGWASNDTDYPWFLGLRQSVSAAPDVPPPAITTSPAGNAAMVRLLLEYKATINTIGGSGRSALINAAAGGNLPIVKLLVEHGADVNLKQRDGGTALIWAIRKSHREVVRYLLAHGADCHSATTGTMGKDAGSWAAMQGDEELQRLVQACAGNTNVKAAFTEAVTWGSNPDIVQSLLDRGADIKGPGDNPLAMALHMNHLDIARLLLKKGGDTRTPLYGKTPLMYAVERGQQDIVRGLLAAGADPNARAERSGESALMMAVKKNDAALVSILMDGQALARIADKAGVTPLIEAAYKGNVLIVNSLIEHGADLDSQDQFGSTALIEASADGHEDVVKSLIARGAKVNLSTARGSTAHDCALTAAVRALLEANGGKPGNGCQGGP